VCERERGQSAAQSAVNKVCLQHTRGGGVQHTWKMPSPVSTRCPAHSPFSATHCPPSSTHSWSSRIEAYQSTVRSAVSKVGPVRPHAVSDTPPPRHQHTPSRHQHTPSRHHDTLSRHRNTMCTKHEGVLHLLVSTLDIVSRVASRKNTTCVCNTLPRKGGRVSLVRKSPPYCDGVAGTPGEGALRLHKSQQRQPKVCHR